jgi:opacity protein-like surface antigen
VAYWRGLIVVLFAFALGAATTFGQAQHEFEVTPFGGVRFGGRIQFSPAATYTNNSGATQTVDYIGIKSSFDYGVYADYSIWPSFQAEFMWNRQPTELRAHDAVFGGLTDIGSANLDMYQWGILWEMRGEPAKIRPEVGFGLGFTHFGTYGVLPDMNYRFAYNVGGGVKYEFSRHVGLRFDVRYSPTHTTQQSGYAYDPYYGTVPVTVTNKAHQGQANLGVIFKF